MRPLPSPLPPAPASNTHAPTDDTTPCHRDSHSHSDIGAKHYRPTQPQPQPQPQALPPARRQRHQLRILPCRQCIGLSFPSPNVRPSTACHRCQGMGRGLSVRSIPQASLLFLQTPSLLLLLLLLFSLSVCQLPAIADAHSFLTYPEPYTRCGNLGRHNCPSFLRDVGNRNCVKANTTERRPAAEWGRGDRVVVKWARNNHNGGFIRMGLVPVAKMYDARAIERLSFYYGCWEQGRHRCKGIQCGSDNGGWAFQRRITVPRSIPDGRYVLAWMWFGGMNQARDAGQFGDYSSCAFVTISGGKPYVKKPIQPFFAAGTPAEIRHRRRNKLPLRKSCWSASNRPGTCRFGRRCHRFRARGRRPYPFGETVDVRVQVRVRKRVYIRGKGMRWRWRKQWKVRQQYRKPAPIWQGLFENKDTRPAICNMKFKACCPTRCRECEGNFCARRGRGPHECCPDLVAANARPCARTGGRAPCSLV